MGAREVFTFSHFVKYIHFSLPPPILSHLESFRMTFFLREMWLPEKSVVYSPSNN